MTHVSAVKDAGEEREEEEEKGENDENAGLEMDEHEIDYGDVKEIMS